MQDKGIVLTCEKRVGMRARVFATLLFCIVMAAPGMVLAQSSGGASGGPKTGTGKNKTKDSGPLCMHNCSSSREKTYDLRNQTYTGETVGGPLTVVAKNLNILRYKYTANSKVTLSKPPDLWSELTNIANPQGTTTSPSPAKGEPKAPLVSSLPSAFLARARSASPSDRAMSAAAKELGARIDAALDEERQAVAAVAIATKGFPELKKATDKDFEKVAGQVKNANIASDRVNAGGQELLSFLKSVDSSSTYAGIKDELSPEFKFMAGVNAQWPSSSDISELKLTVDRRTTILSQAKTDFEGKRGSLIAGLTVAQRDIYSVKNDLDQFARQIQGGATAAGDKNAVEDDRSKIKTALDEIDTSNIDLNTGYAFLSSAIATSDQMETAVSNLDRAGDKYKAFQQAQAQLSDWHQQMIKINTDWDLHSAVGADQQLHPDPFSMRISGTCDYAFSSTKQTAVTLTATDQLPDKSANAPATVLSVTIECASPFNVSAGVAFSGIPDQEYAIHPVATPKGSTTTTNQFVQTSDSIFHPVVIGMVSARLWEPCERVAVHASFGLAGSFKSQSAGGSSAEFLIGPSLSLFRTMFITPGLYIGKKTVLADGFTVGSPVPSNITTPPLQSSYKPAFGVAITFTKP